MNSEFSIVTIVKQRTEQLSNLISSLEHSTQLPKEMVIVWMTSPSDKSLLSSDHFSIKHCFATSDELPIAQARHRGFESCTTDKCIYLDVDCICPQDLLMALVSALSKGTVVTANVCPLQSMVEDIDETSVQQLTAPPVVTAEKVPFIHFDDTIFGITRHDYEQLGGFDLDYQGFGLGDQDFAMRCSQLGLFLLNIGRHVFKQFHVHFEPPLNHLCDLVANAETFKQKWGAYPHYAYFADFIELGLINADYVQNGMRATRLVDQKELQRYLVKRPDPGVSVPTLQLRETA